MEGWKDEREGGREEGEEGKKKGRGKGRKFFYFILISFPYSSLILLSILRYS